MPAPRLAQSMLLRFVVQMHTLQLPHLTRRFSQAVHPSSYLEKRRTEGQQNVVLKVAAGCVDVRGRLALEVEGIWICESIFVVIGFGL